MLYYLIFLLILAHPAGDRTGADAHCTETVVFPPGKQWSLYHTGPRVDGFTSGFPWSQEVQESLCADFGVVWCVARGWGLQTPQLLAAFNVLGIFCCLLVAFLPTNPSIILS